MMRQFNFRIYFETADPAWAYIDFVTEPIESEETAWCWAIAHASLYAEQYRMTIRCIMEGMKV